MAAVDGVDDVADGVGILNLPNEILLKIVRELPQRAIFLGVAHTNRRLRQIVASNLNTLPLFDVHCHVHVVDSPPGYNYRGDGTDPIISYSFTVFDPRRPDFKQKRRLCLRGNDVSFRELHVAHAYANPDSTMIAEFDAPEKDCRVPQHVALTLLSYMRVTALRFQVQKQCRSESKRLQDEFFADCVAFCERRCTKVSVKSLLLCSKNVLFPWMLGQRSLRRLAALRCLRTLVLENMTSFDPLLPVLTEPLESLCSLQLRLDQRHRMDVDRITWAPIDGAILDALASAAVRHLDFTAYVDVSAVVSAITAGEMCAFIMSWRCSDRPWMIRSIAFNSTVTIDEFRSAALRTFPEGELLDVPYCRFRIFHPRCPQAALELACYANGNATQWLFRAGFVKTPN